MVSHMTMATYQIHNNGSIPYIVEVSPTKVIIKKRNPNFNVLPDQMVYVNFREYNNYRKILIGKDFRLADFIQNEQLDYERQDGNSILINHHGKKYTHIGSEIYDFDAQDDIVDYFSPVGNNDVPYPYAIGEKYIYLMLEKKYILKELINITSKSPYATYYNIHEIVSGMKYFTEQFNLKMTNQPYDHDIDEIDEELNDDPNMMRHIPGVNDAVYFEYITAKFGIDKSFLTKYSQFKSFDVRNIGN